MHWSIDLEDHEADRLCPWSSLPAHPSPCSSITAMRTTAASHEVCGMNILFSILPVYCTHGVPTRLSLTFHTLTSWLGMVSGPIFKEFF